MNVKKEKKANLVSQDHGNCPEKEEKPRKTKISERNLTKSFRKLLEEAKNSTSIASVKTLKMETQGNLSKDL